MQIAFDFFLFCYREINQNFINDFIEDRMLITKKLTKRIYQMSLIYTLA